MVKILILGHGEHGKDTAADIITEYTGLSFESSSMAAAEIAVLPHMPQYTSAKRCFDDRRNHREEWKRLITRHNTPDKDRLCREILTRCDGYVGMRCPEEYAASRAMFDHILWIDGSDRKPADPTMGIIYSEEMVLIDNNWCEGNLGIKLYDWCVGNRLCSP